MERYLGLILILLLALFSLSDFTPLQDGAARVAGISSSSSETLPVNQPVITESSFTEKLQEETVKRQKEKELQKLEEETLKAESETQAVVKQEEDKTLTSNHAP